MNKNKIGHYEVVCELGRGGMGVVYKGWDTTLNRFVAIKVLTDQLASDSDFLRRFSREAQAAAALSHPNIINVFFIGEAAGSPFFVMEFVSGRSIHQLIRERGQIGNPHASQIVLQAAYGLVSAHERGIIHRDIKPANLMLDEEGRVRIADFGLALPADTESRITATGMLMGTPGYLAPEQCRGETADARTDIYALGVTFFELLTGVLPFRAESPFALLKQILDGEPPDIASLNPDVDEATQTILKKMICKDRSRRYQNCRQIVNDLEEVLASHGVRNPTVGLSDSQLSTELFQPKANLPSISRASGSSSASRNENPIDQAQGEWPQRQTDPTLPSNRGGSQATSPSLSTRRLGTTREGAIALLATLIAGSATAYLLMNTLNEEKIQPSVSEDARSSASETRVAVGDTSPDVLLTGPGTRAADYSSIPQLPSSSTSRGTSIEQAQPPLASQPRNDSRERSNEGSSPASIATPVEEGANDAAHAQRNPPTTEAVASLPEPVGASKTKPIVVPSATPSGRVAFIGGNERSGKSRKDGDRVIVEGQEARRTPSGTIEVRVVLRNQTDRDLQVEGRSQFFDEGLIPADGPTAWQRVFLPANSSGVYSEFSVKGFAVPHYLVEFRGPD